MLLPSDTGCREPNEEDEDLSVVDGADAAASGSDPDSSSRHKSSAQDVGTKAPSEPLELEAPMEEPDFTPEVSDGMGTRLGAAWMSSTKSKTNMM